MSLYITPRYIYTWGLYIVWGAPKVFLRHLVNDVCSYNMCQCQEFWNSWLIPSLSYHVACLVPAWLSSSPLCFLFDSDYSGTCFVPVKWKYYFLGNYKQFVFVKFTWKWNSTFLASRSVNFTSMWSSSLITNLPHPYSFYLFLMDTQLAHVRTRYVPETCIWNVVT